MKENKRIILIGYSGHSYVLCDIFASQELKVVGYCDSEFKEFNPYKLAFYGSELSEEGEKGLIENDYFIAVGNNTIRRKIQSKLYEKGLQAPANAIHSSALIGSHVSIGNGVMIAQNAVINAQVKIGDGVVCNTACVIEHEVEVGAYSFIAPNATLLGGVFVGENCFIGANATVIQNVKIGENSIIGAGSVILKDVPPNSKVVGNPARYL